MKKAKVIILSSALSLITIGVLAGKAKFAPANVYADISGTMVQLDNASSFSGLTTTASGNQAKIVSSSTGSQYNLYTRDGVTNIPLYTNGF